MKTCNWRHDIWWDQGCMRVVPQNIIQLIHIHYHQNQSRQLLAKMTAVTTSHLIMLLTIPRMTLCDHPSYSRMLDSWPLSWWQLPPHQCGWATTNTSLQAEFDQYLDPPVSPGTCYINELSSNATFAISHVEISYVCHCHWWCKQQ